MHSNALVPLLHSDNFPSLGPECKADDFALGEATYFAFTAGSEGASVSSVSQYRKESVSEMNRWRCLSR